MDEDPRSRGWVGAFTAAAVIIYALTTGSILHDWFVATGSSEVWKNTVMATMAAIVICGVATFILGLLIRGVMWLWWRATGK
jgi:hypothetical protein